MEIIKCKRRYLVFPLTIVVFLTAFTSCLESKPAAESSPVVPEEIIPGTEQEKLEENLTKSSDGDEEYQTDISPQVDIPPDYTLLTTINVNLDFDQTEEQILVFKKRETPDSTIKIAVVDFDTVRNLYKISWQGETRATNIRTFNITLEDLVGDHNLEIICSGTNKMGDRTLNIFRKTHAPSGINIYYTSICEIVSSGTIEIQEKERSQAYKLGQKNGISFPIVTYSHDPDSENIMDLIKTTYYWQYQQEEYVKGVEEKIPGKEIEEVQLQELFQKGPEAFEKFLDGPWYSSSSEEDTAPGKSTEILLFESKKRSITFYSENVQEVYEWSSSHRTRIPNSLYINTRNELVPFIEKQISIYILSLDSILVSVYDNELKKRESPWDGKYFKLSPSLRKNFQKATSEIKNPENINLTGHYTSEDNIEIYFNFPWFRMIEKNQVIRGGYSIYNVREPIIELKIMGEDGLIKGIKRFKLEFSEDKIENKIVRTCVLVPGSLVIDGFKPNGDSPLRFMQIEILEGEDPIGSTSSSEKEARSSLKES